jgi:hypothetical protein
LRLAADGRYGWTIGRAQAVGDTNRQSTAGVWPYVAATTCLVLVVPIAVVWTLGASGVITSGWIAALLGAALSLLAAVAANAAWKRRSVPCDVPFGDLLPWGWVRRIRAERRLTNAVAVLSVSDAEDSAERERVLKDVAAALDAQDPYLDGHSKRVARYAAITAGRMGLPDEEVARIRAAATIHDVGKLRVSTEVVRKPDALTDAEYEEIKSHAVHGADLVSCLRDPDLTSIVRHHHERFDGAGYPDGLRGESIPLGARIVAVADTFDALTSPRPYRPAATHKRALDVLVEEAGDQLDPAVVRAFLGYYRGTRGVALWGLLGVAVGRRRELAPLLVALPVIGVTAAVGVTAGAPRDRLVDGRWTTAPAALSPPRPAVTPSRSHGAGPGPSSAPSSATEAAATTRRAAATTRAVASRQRGGRNSAETRPLAGPRAGEPRAGSTPAQRRRRAPPATPRPVSRSRARGPRPSVTTPAPGPAPAPAPAPGSAPAPPPTASPATPSAPPPAATPPPPVVTPVPPPSARTAPATKDACKHRGYVQYGFPNQGSCVAAVNHVQQRTP